MRLLQKSVILGFMFLFAFWGSAVRAASPEAAIPPDEGTIRFSATDLPDELLARSILATVSVGPANSPTAQILLSGLNDFSDSVEVPAGDYFCTAVVQYDPAGDFPLVEQNDRAMITVQAGEETQVVYTVSPTGLYQSLTGKTRAFRTVETEAPPAGYDAERSAQIGVYFTAPEGFDQHIVVYLGNRYTGKVYALDVYAANLLAAVEQNATAGKYQYLGAEVAGDTAGRYAFTPERTIISTDADATFPITVTDTKNPNRKMVTPSRESSTDATPDTASPTRSATAATPAQTDAPPAAPASAKAFPFWLVNLGILGALCAGGMYAVYKLRSRRK